MKRHQASKNDARKSLAPESTLQAGALNASQAPAKADQVQRPAHWDRYVDSRMKQFCMR
jgi:hypothetical protein